MLKNETRRERRKNIEEYLCEIDPEKFVDPPRPNLSDNEKILKYMCLRNCPFHLVPQILADEMDNFLNTYI